MRSSASRVTVTDLAYASDDDTAVVPAAVAWAEEVGSFPPLPSESPVHAMQREVERRVQQSFGHREELAPEKSSFGTTTVVAISGALVVACLWAALAIFA